MNAMMQVLMRRKPLGPPVQHDGTGLKRSLSWPHLIALGVGAIVGTGIYTLIGVGADRAGPAVIIAFAIAGAICACAALAYAELATLIPQAGSAYTYSYSVLGEVVGWLVGWSLILEYSVACSAVAVGWSAYMTGLLQSIGIVLPAALTAGPHAGGLLNLPAMLIVALVGGLLMLGTRESATVNMVLVFIKLAALALFVALALPAMDMDNFTPFMPHGFGSEASGDTVRGVMAAAAIVFFAFFGFDAVSTAAEETRNPSRDLVIGIVGSMALCVTLYMAVAASAVGAWPFQAFADSGEPLAFVLRSLEHPLAAKLVAAAAIIALPTVIMVMMFGQTRVFMVMARDGLLPQRLSRIHPRRNTPMLLTAIVAVFVMMIAGFFRLDEIAELSNAGTLSAFIAVAVCMLVLRVRQPDLPRAFRCPAPWIIGPAAIIGCLYLIISLPPTTIGRFLAWNALGLVVYFLYGRRHSLLAGK